MSKRKDYGKWQRPAFGRLHTRRASPHSLATIFSAPREGSGDYRHPVARGVGSGPNGTRPSSANLWSNRVAVVIELPYRDDSREAEYIPVCNGVPEFRPYVWRSPGWESRLTRFGLDLAALSEADLQIEQEIADRIHDYYRPNARKYKRRKVLAS